MGKRFRGASAATAFAVSGLVTLVLTSSALAASPPNVYFIGDSVTAGFGYCGTEGGANSSSITCKSNQPFADAWKFGDNSLSDCEPPDPANDRCSNNNDKGAPWNAPAWAPGPTAPTVAYSYVIAAEQGGAAKAPIYNWAVTGSTPANWDTNGFLHGHLEAIKNSYVVMTLGANPLLSYYLKVKGLGISLLNGKCADSTVVGSFFTGYKAAQLNGGEFGVLKCFNDNWSSLDQTRHLVSIYKSLIQQGDHVLVVGYPPTCPWSFGNFQPEANLEDGPSKGHACTTQKYPEWHGPHGKDITQFEQAVALGDDANSKLQAAVAEAGKSAPAGQKVIAYAAPDKAAWEQHEPWSSDSWVFKNDTWVHPSVAGHRALARTVVGAMCADFQHWCGNPPRW